MDDALIHSLPYPGYGFSQVKHSLYTQILTVMSFLLGETLTHTI